METAPLFLDLGKPKPTVRQIADLVKAGGAGALTEAIRRADAARYQEVRCRSALNRVKGMPFDWTLNPYRGCTHGCHYCLSLIHISRAHETPEHLVCRLLLEKKKKN